MKAPFLMLPVRTVRTLQPALVLLAALLILPALAAPSASGQASRDADGGFDADYSSVARFRQIDDQALTSFEDDLARRGAAPFAARLIRPGGAAAGKGPLALILVETALYTPLKPEIDQYALDLEDDGFTAETYTLSGGTAQDLKNFILAHSTNLAGCALVGDLPAAWYELDVWGHEEFPSDLYFMDLDGTWSDSDGDGRFDGHAAGSGDEGPEIYLGRIATHMMSGDEVTLLRDYFAKDHTYRHGGFPAPDYGCTYTEDDWAYILDMRQAMGHTYPGFDEFVAPDTTRNDYLYNRVPNQAYEFLQLSCHSSPTAHYFTRGGQAKNYQIKNEIPHALFVNLFCCSSLRFTEANYLGGSYIHNASATSLAVVGSTKTGSMLTFNPFYKTFGQVETLGEAFRYWFNYLAPFSDNERAWHYGMVIAGDPFLRRSRPALTLSFPDGPPAASLPPGPAPRYRIRIEAGLQTVTPGTEVIHYRYDPADPFTSVNLTALGNDLFEAVLPGVRPGDAPEFYFAATGDFGTEITSPADAPAEVYAADVHLVEPVLEDDFETDLGWTVENVKVATGGWERGNPEGTGPQPEDDHSPVGDRCFVTGVTGGAPSANDLDGGPTRLLSPEVDLSGGDGELSFHLWFHHDETGTEDPFRVQLSNDGGATWVLVEEFSHHPAWQYRTYRVSDHVAPTDRVRVRFACRDQPDDGVVEALVDDVILGRIVETPSLFADAYSLSAAEGAQVDYFLEAGTAFAGRKYLLMGGFSGTAPGFVLPGGQQVPLNWDLFTQVSTNAAYGAAFQGFLGVLDATGAAQATLDTLGPVANPLVIGHRAHFVFVTGPPPGWDFASNAVVLDFLP